jgi:lactate dehydrogenase-like 2-hydroxyacid dehydrogenase
MQKHRILSFLSLPADLNAALHKRYDLIPFNGLSNSLYPGVDIAVTSGMVGATAEYFDACPDLRLLVSQGAGLDKIDLPEATRRGIAVAHTPDELTEDVGDAAIAMIYAALRGIVRADRFVRAGRWKTERIAPAHRVGGKTIGIVGLGRIGLHIARRAEAVGMTVQYHGRRPLPDVPYPFVLGLLDLAANADVLVLSCPGGEATHHLVGRDVLAQLGPKGLLVNIARGSVVDEVALLDALEAGTLGGAALDVYEHEPDINPRFLKLDNVTLTPHAASITYETRAAIIDRMLNDIDAFLTGRPFFNAAR